MPPQPHVAQPHVFTTGAGHERFVCAKTVLAGATAKKVTTVQRLIKMPANRTASIRTRPALCTMAKPFRTKPPHDSLAENDTLGKGHFTAIWILSYTSPSNKSATASAPGSVTPCKFAAET